MAGRAKVGGDVTPVRFADGVLARIDAVAGKGRRAEFIREAVDRALSETGRKTKHIDAVQLGGLNSLLVEVFNPVMIPTALMPPKDGTKAQLDRVARIREAEQFRADKMKQLLEAVKRRPMTTRQAATELAWPELLAVKTAEKLEAAGLVHFPSGGGVMEAK